MIEFLKAFLMWFIVFSSSAFATSLTVKWKEKMGVLTMQTTMFLLSFLLIALINPGLLKLQVDIKIVTLAILSGFILSFSLNIIGRNSSPSMPSFFPRGVERVFILLFLAPLSEETLNRALIEGYLLSYGHFWSAIFFSALLFSLPHWMAFEGKKGERGFIVIGAFLLGSLAGYFYALGGIFPAFLAHSSANLAGMVAEKPGRGM
ncbi:CPBP family intramembrane glutamic endopeptidase [Thermococcus celer]|uniref:CAAX protease n=1 Tax=Thermococcus celer Vu 13 = JCM 8558 TaxID=1293037 RepID=A0A218P2A2_THECE|nr:CPBP family intramembrane glutamic endopeptidase [Thermococcus celer]ASI99034.1 CAAX protease [Thermococcus celer] [Thermococcus celer Vu 13 = JCM 8558]